MSDTPQSPPPSPQNPPPIKLPVPLGAQQDFIIILRDRAETQVGQVFLAQGAAIQKQTGRIVAIAPNVPDHIRDIFTNKQSVLFAEHAMTVLKPEGALEKDEYYLGSWHTIWGVYPND